MEWSMVEEFSRREADLQAAIASGKLTDEYTV
jgi:hypothetical protein